MPRSTATLEKRKKQLTDRLMHHLDILIGTVVAYRLKCGKNCRCNQGKKHLGFYLSVRSEGKTRNLYLPKDLVPRAREMSRQHQKLKKLLREVSQVNYELLRATEGAVGSKQK